MITTQTFAVNSISGGLFFWKRTQRVRRLSQWHDVHIQGLPPSAYGLISGPAALCVLLSNDGVSSISELAFNSSDFKHSLTFPFQTVTVDNVSNRHSFHKEQHFNCQKNSVCKSKTRIAVFQLQ